MPHRLLTIGHHQWDRHRSLPLCAQACVSGLDAEAAFRLASYQGAIGQATAALAPYGMTP